MNNQDEKAKKVMDVRWNGETNGLPNAISPFSNLNLNHHYQQKLVLGDSPLSRVSQRSEYSQSSSFSNGMCSSDADADADAGSPFSAAFEENKYSGYYGLGLDSRSLPDQSHFKKNANTEKLGDDLGLWEDLCRLNISDNNNNNDRTKRFGMNLNGFSSRFNDESSGFNWSVHCNTENCFEKPAWDSQQFQYIPSTLKDGMSSVPLFPYGYEDYNSKRSTLADNQSNNFSFNTIWNKNLDEQRKEEGRINWTTDQNQWRNQASGYKPYYGDVFSTAQNHGTRGISDPLRSSSLNGYSPFGMNIGSLHTSKERTYPMQQTGSTVMEGLGFSGGGFGCQGSFNIQGKDLEYGMLKGNNNHYPPSLCHYKGYAQEKSTGLYNPINHGVVYGNGHSLTRNSNAVAQFLLPSHSSLAKVMGSIYFMAKDQNGCRFLQRIFDEGTFQDVLIIFREIIGHVIELMVDPFGNYLVQKLLDVCSEEQRTQIVHVVTREPGQLVRISLNTYGTRVVQKLVETLKTGNQISLLKSALRPGFLDLIKDLNGNHVIQRCLQCLKPEDNKFIFDAATMFCVDIATHRHGCCVLQRCIAHSIAQQRDKLITEISKNGLRLAQDPFGNYVVQYIIQLKSHSAITLLTQFKGNYAQLSSQKFSSHVVEKCLTHFSESRPQIVRELLLGPPFEQLLQDPYANYVIQCALSVTKGDIHSQLVEALRPHTILRTSPYCKRIFSRSLLKK